MSAHLTGAITMKDVLITAGIAAATFIALNWLASQVPVVAKITHAA